MTGKELLWIVATVLGASLAAVAAGLILFLSVPRVHARDLDGRYSNSPHKPWFDAQTNGHGTSCCHEGDAHRFDGAYTLNSDGTVTLGTNPQRTLPDWMVLKGKNPTGSAIWWFRDYENGTHTDYCFSPGTLS